MQEQTQENTEKEKERDIPDRHTHAARSVVLEVELSEGFFTMIRSFEADMKPQTGIERALIEDIAVNRWRQIRARFLEKALLDYEHSHNQIEEEMTHATRVALSLRSASNDSRIFDLLGRQENRHQRSIASALQLLLKLRASRETTVDHSAPTRADQSWRTANGRTAPPPASAKPFEYMEDSFEPNRKENL